MRSKKYLGLFSFFQYKLIALLLFKKIIFLSFLIARETSADSCKCRFSFNAYSVDIIIISTLKCRPDPINGANYDTNQPFGCNYIYSRDLNFQLRLRLHIAIISILVRVIEAVHVEQHKQPISFSFFLFFRIWGDTRSLRMPPGELYT